MSNKFTLKCGNFAVLVDLHALPQGAQGDSSWFSQHLKEEVSVLIREAVDRRVKQFVESQHQHRHQQQQQQPSSRGAQSRQRTEHSPTSPLYVKGPAFRLAAYFMKRHVNLRCITNRRHRDLRVFPERFVVCVSRPEDAVAAAEAAAASALGGNAARPMEEEQGGQSKSEYFSGRGETLDPLNNSAITKRTALQKIAKQAISRAEPSSSSSNHSDQPSQTSVQQQEARGQSAAAASLSDSPPLSPSASMHPLPPPPPPPLLPPPPPSHLVQERSAGYGCVGEIPGGAVATSLRASVSASVSSSLEGGEGEALAPLSPSKPRNEHHSGTAGRDVAANPQRLESSSSSSSSSKSSSSTTAATTTTSTTTTSTTTMSKAPPQSQPGMGVHNNNNMDSNSSSSSSSNGSGNSRGSRSKKRPSRLPQGGDAHVVQRCKRLRLAEPPETTAEVSERPDQSAERASPQSSELGPSPCPPPPLPPSLLPPSRPPLPPPSLAQEHAGGSRTPPGPGPGAGRAAHGRQARRLPPRVNNTEQSTGPGASSLATTASLRSVSVKPISSGSSISSRPDAKEERERGKEGEERKEKEREMRGEEEGKERREAQEGRQSSAAAARTSRLRRPKKS